MRKITGKFLKAHTGANKIPLSPREKAKLENSFHGERAERARNLIPCRVVIAESKEKSDVYLISFQ